MSSQENIDYVNELVANAPVMGGVPDSWCDIVADCHREMLATGIEFRVDQIKEKFGGLRFYYSTKSDCAGGSDEEWESLWEITRKAEEAVWKLEDSK